MTYQIIASFLFGSLFVVFLVTAYHRGGVLSVPQQRILAVLAALTAGLFGAFLTGAIASSVSGVLQVSGGFFLFVVVLLWWFSDFRPRKAPETGRRDRLAKQVTRVPVIDNTYGVYYQQEAAPADLLVVLIHGITGDPVASWSGLPDLLCEAVSAWTDPERPVSFDVFSFGYPAKLAFRARIEDAASELRNCLTQLPPYKDHAHIIFAVHSTGGLVLKRALLDDMNRRLEVLAGMEAGSESGRKMVADLERSLVGRSRRIFNIAVPHSGASKLATATVVPLYHVLIPWFWFLGRILAAVPRLGRRYGWRDGYAYGRNQITWQLRANNPDLIRWEEEYRLRRDRFDELRLPRPVAFEINGNLDNAIGAAQLDADQIDPDRGRASRRHAADHGEPGRDDPDRAVAPGRRAAADQAGLRMTAARDTLVLRGTHPSVKLADGPGAPIVQLLAEPITQFGWHPDITVAETVLRQTLDFNGPTAPIGVMPPRHGDVGTDSQGGGLTEGEQQSLLKRLRDQVWRNNTQTTPLTIVTGVAGVGKTFMLRLFARELALKILDQGDDVLPVFIPLQVFPDIRGDAIWDELFPRFVTWASSLSAKPALPAEVERRMAQKRAVLILDSVDEFQLINRAAIDADDIRSMILRLRALWAGGRSVAIVLGIRRGEPILLELKDDADQVLEVGLLTYEQSIAHFPETKPVLDKVLAQGDKDLLEVLMTPLILAAINDMGRDRIQEEVATSALRTRSQIVDFALRAVIRKSNLVEEFRLEDDPESPRTTMEDWRNALMVLSMLFSAGASAVAYEGGVGSVSHGEVVEDVAKIEKVWEKHKWRPTDLSFRSDLKRAFTLLKNRERFHRLCERTVFFPTGSQVTTEGDRRNHGPRYRFQHRVWQDHLFGRYYALCIRTLNPAELARCSFTLDAFRTGAEVLETEGYDRIENEFVSRILVLFNGPSGQFAMGNFGGLVSAGQLAIHPNEIKLLTDYFLHPESRTTCVVPKMPGVFSKAGDMTFYNGLGQRLLRSDLGKRAGWDDEFSQFVPKVWPHLGKLVHEPWSSDPSAAELLKAYEPMLRFSLHEGTRPLDPARPKNAGNNALLASLAWCFLSALTLKLGNAGVAPQVPWPGLDMTPDQELDMLNFSIAQVGPDGAIRREPLNDSVQLAYLSSQIAVLRYPRSRPVSIVHYLFALALGVKHGIENRVVRAGLRAIFREGGPYEAIYQNYPIPAVGEIYRLCRSYAAPHR